MGKSFEALTRYKKEVGSLGSVPALDESAESQKREKVSRLIFETADSDLSADDARSIESKRTENIPSISQQRDTEMNNDHGENGKSEFAIDSEADVSSFDKSLISILKPKSFAAEQFKILRTHLLYPSKGKPPRSILVTSTAPGDGKTFVAANLAINMSLTINKYVLLIDSDLRQPKVHSRFGFEDVCGLSDYLGGKKKLEDLFLKTELDRLTILPAGSIPSNPSELLSSERMASLMKEVVDRYRDRYIIIDSPPPLLTAEAGALASQVDGILLVVNYGKTRRADLKNLIEKLGKDKLLGTVINNVNLRYLNQHYVLRKYRSYGHYYNNNTSDDG